MLIISYWWFIDEYISMLFMEIWDVYYCLLIAHPAHPKADWQAVGFPNCLGEKPWVGTARISCSTTWVFQVRCRCGFVDLIRSCFGTFDIRQQGAASSMFHTQLWKMGRGIFCSCNNGKHQLMVSKIQEVKELSPWPAWWAACSSSVF